MKLWNLSTGQVQAGYDFLSDRILNVAFSRRNPPGVERWAAAGSDGVVRIWKSSARGEPVRLRGDPQRVFALAFSPDGRRLAAVGYDGSVQLWDPATGQNVLILRPPGPQRPESIASDSQVVFSRDGTRLAVNSWTGQIHVWDGRPLPGDHGKAAPR